MSTRRQPSQITKAYLPNDVKCIIQRTSSVYNFKILSFSLVCFSHQLCCVQEPEYLKMMKYGLRQASVFLTSHGVSMPLAGLGGAGPQLVYEDPFGTNTVAEGEYALAKPTVITCIH